MVEIWPAILVAGGTFAATQFVMATCLGPGLVDVAAAAATMAALVGFLRLWRPKRILNARGQDITGNERQGEKQSAAATFKAWMPWLILSVMVFVWGIPGLQHWMNTKTTVFLPVAGLHNLIERMPPVATKATPESAVFTLNWLAAAGTGILVAAVLAGLAMGLRPAGVVPRVRQDLFSIRFTALTIATMMALGFVMRYCGLDATLGLAFARSGALYPFFGTLIGWLGTATTGSDTSSNVLFGNLQQMTAGQIGVSPVLMAGANSTGGVMGKMISAPSIVVASTVTESYGQEGTILKFVFWHSLALAALVGVFVYLIAYVAPFTGLVPK